MNESKSGADDFEDAHRPRDTTSGSTALPSGATGLAVTPFAGRIGRGLLLGRETLQTGRTSEAQVLMADVYAEDYGIFGPRSVSGANGQRRRRVTRTFIVNRRSQYLWKPSILPTTGSGFLEVSQSHNV